MSVDYVKYVSEKTKSIIANTKKCFSDLKEKLNNLEAVNIKLAKQYLDDNKLNEAYFRLKIIHLLWPNNVDGTYFYAVLLILSEKKDKAVEVLSKINNDEHINKLLHVAKDHNADYILDTVEKNNIKLSELSNVL